MPTARLGLESRNEARAALTAPDGVDILVIGGGVTGAGIALDAATRGLSVGIVDAQDWGAGTSSRSSRLVHGGLRYLYNLDFKLVAESLRERGTLLTKTAPHLVTAQPFLWPLRQRVIERAYSAVGVGMYDLIAIAGARHRTVPLQHHYSRKRTLEVFPDARAEALVGSIRFCDAKVDDARLVNTLVRTAVRYGAHALSHAEVVELVREGTRVTGAVVHDRETGERLSIRAGHVIGAVGVWTEHLQRLAGSEGPLRVHASKGIHLVIPRDRIKGSTGMFLRTEKSVLFIIPWTEHWIIGTTDTSWHEDLTHPVATTADIDYLLEHANAVLTSELTRSDIIGVYAGLRPLLQPVLTDEASTAKISREHTVARVTDGLSVIAGGKLTTYRVMAEDAVDFAIGARAKVLPSVTANTPLLGATGLDAMRRIAPRLGAKRGWDLARVEHLLARYGSAITEVAELIDDDPSLGRPLAAAPQYLRAEVAYAVTHEGALTVADVLMRRVRLAIESEDRGLGALDEIIEIITPLLGWGEERAEREASEWHATCTAQETALRTATDAEASAARAEAGDGEIGARV
ncbi:MAG TPA: glycerol-3-phosphate dehydrogenase/oxidase [Actinomycetaceae bacterium]|nr:glycerol-3-phosphate dehydrogenase/oxidase [Actinomycetaceae bacterium]